ncbi:MAG: copper amine oxidase N-terminal domain-containing protein [Clostridia bacterium]|nr:copper amine oxidase N-terminal domain-containing protein [Clostridia bacterium]
MKKMISVLLSVTLLFSMASFVQAEEQAPITLTVNGEVVTCDVPPQIVEDYTLVPLRAAFEAVGAMIVLWDESTRTVHAINQEGVFIGLQIGSTTMFTTGEDIEMEVPARIIGDRTMVPIRAIAESLNCDVAWLPEINTVAITK